MKARVIPHFLAGIYICVYVCVRVRVCVYIYMYIYIHIYVYKHIYICICIYQKSQLTNHRIHSVCFRAPPAAPLPDQEMSKFRSSCLDKVHSAASWTLRILDIYIYISNIYIYIYTHIHTYIYKHTITIKFQLAAECTLSKQIRQPNLRNFICSASSLRGMILPSRKLSKISQISDFKCFDVWI